MSQENLRLAHEVMVAFEQGELSRLIGMTDPDVEWRSAFAVAERGGAYRGHEGMRRYVRDMDDAWEVVYLDVDDELAVGDLVVLVGRIHYRGKGSGVEAEAPAGYVIKFREGKVVFFGPFREPEQALEGLVSRE